MGRAIVRYGAALALLFYGFAKVNGSQFTILDSELDKAMGKVSGFWLTWYYFGFSPFYGNLIAFLQIGGALLLTFRRTTLLAACLLAPILANIVLIDVFYGVDPGATVVAVILLAAMLWLIAGQYIELVDLFWVRQQGSSGAASVLKWGLRVAMLAAAFGATYWVANYNNRAPSPIDGAWEVVSAEPSSGATRIPRRIYFEYNRAFLCVFQFADGSYANHHFEADPNRTSLEIWDRWLKKGKSLFAGTYSLAGSRLVLQGDFESSGRLSLQLERRQLR